MNLTVRCNQYHHACKHNLNILLKSDIDANNLLNFLKYINNQPVSCFTVRNVAFSITKMIEDNKDILEEEHYVELSKTGIFDNSVYDKFYPDVLMEMIKRNDKNYMKSYIGRDDVQITEEHIRAYSDNAYSDDLLIGLINRYGIEKVSSELFEGMCYWVRGKRVKNVLKSVIDSGTQITLNAFLHTIHAHNYDMACYMLDNSRVETDMYCLEIACLLREKDIILRLLQHKLIPNKRCFYDLFYDLEYIHKNDLHDTDTSKEVYEHTLDLFEILIFHNYEFEYEDMLYLISIRVEIDNISRFSFDFDERYLEKCFKEDFYPYGLQPTNKVIIKPSLECMYRACGMYDDRKADKKKIKWLVDNGIKPDITCLESLCKQEYNLPVIRYVVQYCKVKPTIQCLLNVMINRDNCYAENLSYIIQKYLENPDKNCYIDPELAKFNNRYDRHRYWRLEIFKGELAKRNPDIKTLKIAIKGTNPKIIKHIVEMHHIIPNIECINCCIKSNGIPEIYRFLWKNIDL